MTLNSKPLWTLRTIVLLIVVAASYFVAGRLGLRLSYLGGNVTLVWPPSGIALAAVLLGGRVQLLAIAVGAMLTTASTGASIGFVLATGLGNTFAAFIGWKFYGQGLPDDGVQRSSLSTCHDLLRFIGLGVLLPAMICSIVGTAGLVLTRMVPLDQSHYAMACWWLGDAMGVLIITPLILTWGRGTSVRFASAGSRVEYAGLLVCICLLGLFAYGSQLASDLAKPLGYAFFPFITWAALRFEFRGVTLAIFLSTAFAVWGTARGSGPFSQESLQLSLGYLYAYMAVVCVTGLLLAAVIGERRQAVKDASDSADRLQLAVRAASIGLWDWDLATNEVTFSPEWKRQLGYEPHEIGNHFREWQIRCHPDDVKFTLDEVKRHLANEQSSFAVEFRMRHKDGSWRWIDSRAQKCVDANGRPTHLIGCHVDISERKTFEVAIMQSEARYRGYFELGLIGMAITSPEKGFIDFNDELCRIFGYSRAQLLQLTWEELAHPDDMVSNRELFDQVMSGQFDRYSMEKRFIRGDGTIIHADVAAQAVRKSDGQIDHFISFIHDISERQRLEEQLRQSQKMEAIGQLAGGAAHDFNNYLTVIMGYCELLLARLPSDHDCRSSVETMYSASERASLLTRQLLAFSRQSVLQPRVISLSSVVLDNEQLLRGLSGENVRLTLDLDSDLKPVFADAGQLTQVIVNLVVNARDAMPDGGEIIIRTSMDSKDAFRSARQVMLSVTDTGQGMSDSVAARVFEPFFTTKAMGKGTGLGLATVYGIVQQSGGHVGVQSEMGHGTTFTITLPASEGDTEAKTARVASGVVSGGSETILLVEDEDAVRDIAAQVLRTHGFHVMAAENATRAIELASSYSQPIHLLLTDVMMPGMNGFQLAQQLTRQRPDLKVLLASGYSRDSRVRDQIVESRLVWLQKPFAPSALIEHVRQVLDGPAITIASANDSRAA